MYNVTVIISINGNHLVKCLNSVLNQSLKNIEIICIYDGDNHSILEKYHEKDKRINLISKDFLLEDINGEYVIEINDVIPNNMLELLYDEASFNDVDLLYVWKYDFFMKDAFNNIDLKYSPLIFSKFYKKEFFNLDDDNLMVKCKKINLFKKYLYCDFNLNQNYINGYINDVVEYGNNLEINFVFSILMEYLNNFPIYYRQKIYDLIKNSFEYDSLNEKNRVIFESILKINYYLDFLNEYSLNSIIYDVYSGLKSTNQNYKISIVIPIYNNETLIHRTLMSIENQSFNFEDIEVLMINDASMDNTFEIINEYADKYPNFKAIHIEKGTGSAGTPRNLGLKLASAEYVLFLDHDDFLDVDALIKLYAKITKYNCDFVYGTYVLIGNDYPIKFIYPNEKHGFFKSLENNPKSITTPPSIWTKLFKKDFLLENNLLFPTILGEDAIFMAKALKHAERVFYLWEDIICYYNLNDESYTSNLSYDYFVEGFVSEEYLFNIFSDWGHKEYYGLRGQGILDYYINRFMDSKLSNDEIEMLFPLFYSFCVRLNQMDINPSTKRNNIIFDYILKKDIEGLIKFKNYKPNKIKVISNKILNKINKHDFW